MNFFDTHITQKAISNVSNVLASGHLSEGEMVRRFEQALQDRFGMRNVVAVNSGTSALHLALVLAGVGEGDEVILPAQTFVSTGLAVLYCGAKPVFADIGMDGNISVEDVLLNITDKTRAVIAVSWGGNPCDLADLSYSCRANGVPLIQDNAHALGATYEGSPLSRFRGFSCYSFQAIKQVTTGDGGALVCDDWDYERAKRLRWFGIDRENDKADETGERVYNLKEIGYKYHMNDYSAALGLGNLSGFEKRQERVKWIAKRYDEDCWDYDNPTWGGAVKKEGCSYWLYDVLVDSRRDFMRAMKDRGVPTSVVHLGIDRNDIFGGRQDLPVQRYWDEHHVCLPIHSSLTDEDVEKVIESVRTGW
jgi:perosamine synthetase